MKTLKNSQTRRNGPDHRKTIWDRVWKDRQGTVVIYQHPNALIITWVVLATLSLFVPTGAVENSFWWLSVIVLAAWALLEIFRGVNYFRQALGLIVLGLTIASVLSIGL